MLIQHSAVEELLRFRIARCLEMHRAEYLAIRLRQCRLDERYSCCGRNGAACLDEGCLEHDPAPNDRRSCPSILSLGQLLEAGYAVAATDAQIPGYVSDLDVSL